MNWYRSDIRNPNDYKTIKLYEELSGHKIRDYMYLKLGSPYTYFKAHKEYKLDLDNNSIDKLKNKPRSLQYYIGGTNDLYKMHIKENEK